MGEGDDNAAERTQSWRNLAAVRFLDLSLDLLGITIHDGAPAGGQRLLGARDGLEREQLLGTTALDYFHADDMPRIMVELAAVLEGQDAPGVPAGSLPRWHCRWVQTARVPTSPTSAST